MKRLALAIVLSLSVVIVATAQYTSSFIIHPAKSEDDKIEAKIPKDWKFVGVDHGTGVSESYLWFQDAGGNIYMVSGYVAPGGLKLGLVGYQIPGGEVDMIELVVVNWDFSSSCL